MSFIDVEVLSHCYNPNPRTKLSLVGVGNGAHTTATIVNGKIRVRACLRIGDANIC